MILGIPHLKKPHILLPQTTKAKLVETASVFLPTPPCLHLHQLSVPCCPATWAQSGNLCQWHGPPPSHPLQYAHTTCAIGSIGRMKFVTVAVEMVEVIPKILMDPRCSTFIIGVTLTCASGWSVSNKLVRIQRTSASAPRFRCSRKTCPFDVLSMVHAPTHYETVGQVVQMVRFQRRIRFVCYMAAVRGKSFVFILQ